MHEIPTFPFTLSAGATATNTTYVGYTDYLLLSIPAVASRFTAGTVVATLLGAATSGATATTCSFYDYANKTPSPCVVTMTTGGVYEIPHPGPVPYVKLSFSEVTTQVVTGNLLLPRTTY
jgi:hypothetical protein